MGQTIVRVHKFLEENSRSNYGTLYTESIDLTLKILDSGGVKLIRKENCTQTILDEEEEENGFLPFIGDTELDLESLIDFDTMIAELMGADAPEIVVGHYHYRSSNLPKVITIRGQPKKSIIEYLSSLSADEY